MLIEISGIKLKLVLENFYDKLKLQTTKTIISSPYGDEMAARQMMVKMSNNNNSQRITVPKMQRHHPGLIYVHHLSIHWKTRVGNIIPDNIVLSHP